MCLSVHYKKPDDPNISLSKYFLLSFFYDNETKNYIGIKIHCKDSWLMKDNISIFKWELYLNFFIVVNADILCLNITKKCLSVA